MPVDERVASPVTAVRTTLLPSSGWTSSAARLPDTPSRYAAGVLLLGAAYYALGELGLAAGQLPGNVTPVWPPTGLALAALIRFGIGYWPGVTLGALLVNGFTAVPLGSVLGMAAGNTAEAVLGAWLFVRFVGGHHRLTQVRDVLLLATLVTTLPILVSATVGVVSLYLGGVVPGTALLETWRVWWAGDALGALVVAPLLLVSGPARGAVTWARALEATALGLLVVGLSVLAFTGVFDHPYLVFPVLIVAALRFHQGGAAWATLAIATVAVVGTRESYGAFAEGSVTHQLWVLDIYLVVVALTGLVLAAMVSERDRAAAENRALAEQLGHNLTELQAAHRELETFSYSVSHDLRAPLRNIDGFARTLQRRNADQLDESGEHYLQRIRFNAHNMATLIDGLLSLSRLQSQPLRTRRTSLREVVDDALAQLEADLVGREVAVTVDSLPVLEVDRTLVTQVYANLIGNAVKFTRGQDVARIEIGCHQGVGSEPDVLFVRDNGVGFDMAEADQLFGAFQRLHRAEDYEGSGVGLAVVHRIVSRHGGTVWAESAPGEGTTVSFTLAPGRVS